jgi:hypothetical protein
VPPHQSGWEQAQAEELRRQQDAWQSELYARRVRATVASRLELVSVRHAEHAWQLRHRFGIAATSLALLYLDHPADGYGLSIAVAGKLFARSELTADTGRLLYDVCGVAREVMTAGADPRVELCEHPDPMSEHAALIGVGVSIVDDDGGPGGGANSRGRVLALLVDDTMLVGAAVGAPPPGTPLRRHQRDDRRVVHPPGTTLATPLGIGRVDRPADPAGVAAPSRTTRHPHRPPGRCPCPTVTC